MDYPSLLFWMLAITGLVSRGPLLIYLFFGSWSFGTLAVIPPELLAGTSFTPSWVCAGLLCAKTLVGSGGGPFLRAATDPRRFALLTLCTVYGVVSAYFMPRLFAGETQVIVMKLITYASPQALAPTTANITQTFYFLLTTATTLSLYLKARNPTDFQQLFRAFRFGAAVAVATGIVDFAASAAGASSLLHPFRNAAYTMMAEVEVLDVKRVVGLQSEASAYAALCMSFLPFLLFSPAGPFGRDRVIKWALCGGLAFAIFASASSGGLVGLVVLAGLAMAVVAWGTMRLRAASLVGAFIGLATLALLLIVWLAAPEWFARPIRLFDLLVLHKNSSMSYIERNMWNDVALRASLDTHLLGAGLGSVRASGWIQAVLGNIGLPGLLMLGGFLVQALLAPNAGGGARAAYARAAKLAVLPHLLLASLSGTAVNYGLGGAWLIGAAFALCWSRAAVPHRQPAHLTGRPPPDASTDLTLERNLTRVT